MCLIGKYRRLYCILVRFPHLDFIIFFFYLNSRLIFAIQTHIQRIWVCKLYFTNNFVREKCFIFRLSFIIFQGLILPVIIIGFVCSVYITHRTIFCAYLLLAPILFNVLFSIPFLSEWFFLSFSWKAVFYFIFSTIACFECGAVGCYHR